MCGNAKHSICSATPGDAVRRAGKKSSVQYFFRLLDLDNIRALVAICSQKSPFCSPNHQLLHFFVERRRPILISPEGPFCSLLPLYVLNVSASQQLPHGVIGDPICGNGSFFVFLKNKHADMDQQPKFKIVKISPEKSSKVGHNVLEGDFGATCLSLETDSETSNLVGIVADCHSGKKRLVAWKGAKKVLETWI